MIVDKKVNIYIYIHIVVSEEDVGDYLVDHQNEKWLVLEPTDEGCDIYSTVLEYWNHYCRENKVKS